MKSSLVSSHYEKSSKWTYTLGYLTKTSSTHIKLTAVLACSPTMWTDSQFQPGFRCLHNNCFDFFFQITEHTKLSCFTCRDASEDFLFVIQRRATPQPDFPGICCINFS